VEHRKYVGRQRQRRQFRVRKRLRGTPARPRLSVFRSHKHIYVQVIDDESGRTLAAASSMDKQLPDLAEGGNKQAAETVGKLIAERALAAGVKQVCFDRGRFQYQGRIAALADSARAAGLDF